MSAMLNNMNQLFMVAAGGIDMAGTMLDSVRERIKKHLLDETFPNFRGFYFEALKLEKVSSGREFLV